MDGQKQNNDIVQMVVNVGGLVEGLVADEIEHDFSEVVFF